MDIITYWYNTESWLHMHMNGRQICVVDDLVFARSQSHSLLPLHSAQVSILELSLVYVYRVWERSLTF